LFLETIPIAETRRYSRLVLNAAAIYGYLYYGKSAEQVVASVF
jgi:soluble lytic murein transglycosylase